MKSLKLKSGSPSATLFFIRKCGRRFCTENCAALLGEVIPETAEQKECRIEEGHLLADHVHMMISIPPKYSVSSVMGLSR